MTDASTEGLGSQDTRRLLLWAVMALPGAYYVLMKLIVGQVLWLEWTGIWACWFLILTLAVTPLQMIFGPIPWLRRNRRYFGVAAFAYSCLHLGTWLVGADLGAILNSFARPKVLVGWIAFFVMIPLAVTSFDSMVRKMGPKWKQLQRWVYVAAVFTLLHWVMTAYFVKIMIVSCVPIVALSAWRYYRYRRRMSARLQA